MARYSLRTGATGSGRNAAAGGQQASGGRQPPEAIDTATLLAATPAELIDRLNSESYAARCDAQAALELLGEPARAELINALEKIKPDRAHGRMHAVWALA